MLFRFELKKLVLLPAIIGFVVLCIVLNAVIAITSYNDYSSNYEVEIVNIFEGLKTSEIAETYIRKYSITGENAENVRNKYEKLQPVIDEKATNGDALSNYFGEQTYYRHSTLFKIMFMAIIAESCLLALFTALISVTYENLRGTEHLISTTKVGRRVLMTKLCASLTATIALTAVIIGVSLSVFFLRYNFSDVWNDNVSSVFNYAVNQYGKPFMTWHSFTVKGYLWSTIGMTFGMVVCFCLLGYVAGVFVRNGYGAIIAAGLVVGITFLGKVLFPIGSVSRAILGLTPIWLWKNSGEWFTDGGADIIWANFEVIGLFVSIILLSISALIATKNYKKEGAIMRIFAYELKKIWNWRILALIIAMGALTWFAFLSESLRSYDSLTTHGIYGSYQNEMFGLYGDTLEPEELADYDIPGKKAALISAMDEIISNETIFTENNIYNYAQYEEFVENGYSSDLSEEEQKIIRETMSTMQSKLDYGNSSQTLDEWYASPLVRLETLEALEHTYIDYEASLRSFIDNDSRPVVVRTAEKLLQMRNANLIRYDLQMTFSLYAAVVGVFTVVAVIILIAPLLTTDRIRKLNLMQYSSTIGRRIFRLQFVATIVSALVLSIILIAAAYIPFLASGAGDYWGTHMMSLAGRGMQLYNITFGQYVLILAGMILALSVGTACFAFTLARFSANIMMMLIKAVPVGVAVAGISVISINMALADNNIIFGTIFHGRFDAPEVILCGFVAVVGLVVGIIISIREKHVDVA